MSSEQSRLFRVAGRVVATDLAGADLEPFEIRPAAPGRAPVGFEPAAGPAAEARLVYRGAGWVVDGNRSVECRVDPLAYRLEIGGVGGFWVARDGGSLGCSRLAPAADPELARLTLLGPALTVALALQGTFCLHASAVHAGSGIFAFAGESGSGKSTLARGLSDPLVCGWRRAGDDVVPIDLASGQPHARTDFPQLKLGAAEQPGAQGPASGPLRAVFLLRPPGVRAPRGEVRIERLGARDSVLALVRHTVAARLFAADLLERHFDFSALVGSRVPVSRLSYPWEPAALPRVAEAIATELDA